MALWTFVPPTVEEGPASWENPLFERVKLSRGVSLLEGPPGTYRAVRFPTQDEVAASQPDFFQGGYEYTVDDDTKAALIAAGVGVTDANFAPAPGTFGAGGFGQGGFGG